MNFKNYINITEVFDKPYKWISQDMSKNISKYFFETDQAEVYTVSLQKSTTYNGYEYYLLSFEDDDGSMHITNKGDAFRVFATVIDIVRSNKSKIEKTYGLVFSSDETSRTKFYTRLIKTLSKNLKFTKNQIFYNDGSYFVLYNDDRFYDSISNNDN